MHSRAAHPARHGGNEVRQVSFVKGSFKLRDSQPVRFPAITGVNAIPVGAGFPRRPGTGTSDPIHKRDRGDMGNEREQ